MGELWQMGVLLVVTVSVAAVAVVRAVGPVAVGTAAVFALSGVIVLLLGHALGLTGRRR